MAAATYVPIVGNNMMVSISGTGTGALSKTNVAAGNGRNSRTRFAVRIDAQAFATDPTITVVLRFPPTGVLPAPATFGTANEPNYLPILRFTQGDLTAAAATVLAFMSVTAVDVTAKTLTFVFTIAAGAAVVHFIEADWSYSAS